MGKFDNIETFLKFATRETSEMPITIKADSAFYQAALCGWLNFRKQKPLKERKKMKTKKATTEEERFKKAEAWVLKKFDKVFKRLAEGDKEGRK